MNAKKDLLESFYKLLTTQIPIMSGYDAEREIIIHLRYIIENCVVIPKEKIDKVSLIKSHEEFTGRKITRYEKRMTVFTELKIVNDESKYVSQSEINDVMLKNLCSYLESEEFGNERDHA